MQRGRPPPPRQSEGGPCTKVRYFVYAALDQSGQVFAPATLGDFLHAWIGRATRFGLLLCSMPGISTGWTDDASLRWPRSQNLAIAALIHKFSRDDWIWRRAAFDVLLWGAGISFSQDPGRCLPALERSEPVDLVPLALRFASFLQEVARIAPVVQPQTE